jgi:hypothetical protein
MVSQSKLSAVLMTVAGIGAVAMFTIAFLKARPKPEDPLSATPATPATSSSVTPPAYDVLSGVSGLTPIQAHPDTLGTSIAPTNPS